jgi:hypothetical protein
MACGLPDGPASEPAPEDTPRRRWTGVRPAIDVGAVGNGDIDTEKACNVARQLQNHLAATQLFRSVR